MLENTLRVGAIAGALLVSVGLTHAQTINFSTGNFHMTGIGADASGGANGSGDAYDILDFTGLATAPLDVSVPVTADIGSLAFTIGPNCEFGTCAIGNKTSPATNFTVNGVTQQFTLPFFWDVSETADTVTFSKPAPLLFNLAGGAKVTVDFLTPGVLSTGEFDTPVTEHVQAKFTFTPAVPEPAAYGMLLAGLAVVGAVARRRGRTSV